MSLVPVMMTDFAVTYSIESGDGLEGVALVMSLIISCRDGHIMVQTKKK